jgi:hypothetical protein
MAVSVVACGGAADDSATSTAAGSPAVSSASSPVSGDVVPHEKLAALFPTIPGFKRETDPKGETDTTEHVSRVQADYKEKK